MGASSADTAHHNPKSALRQHMRSVWSSLDLSAVAAETTATVLGLPEVVGATTVAAYAALPTELPTTDLLEGLRARGVVILLPVLLPGGALAWRRWNPGAPLVAGRRGTTEPRVDAPRASLTEAQAVVVPGLAFDAAGMRLGRGGGSFDRALSESRSHPVVIAMAPDEAIVEHVPAEHHDQRVDVVVTPSRVIRTRPLDS